MTRPHIWFHGTSEKSAAAILETGFLEGTYFAVALEDALEFGGEHIFEVAFEAESRDGWQVRLSNALSAECIVRYSVYSREVRADFPERRKAVFEANAVSRYQARPATLNEPCHPA